jgi:hypothetical protein
MEVIEVSAFDADDLASILEDHLTWRQLRKLAKWNDLKQYSYLDKRGLSIMLAYTAHNRTKRQKQHRVIPSA